MIVLGKNIMLFPIYDTILFKMARNKVNNINKFKRFAMKVKDILKSKGPEVFTIAENKSVKEAMQVLINNNIGVLLVLDNGAKIAGIVSERDILRTINNNLENFADLSISDIMTKKIIYADYEDDIDYLEEIITSNRIRHVPVLKNKTLVGLISIGDIIKFNLKDKKYENKYLMDYIAGAVK